MLGVKQIEFRGREGDDVIGRLSRELSEIKVVISDDKDMLQLVSQNCHVYRPMADDLIMFDNFRQKVGVPRSLFLLMKCITGDASDNVPGIEKVGDVTAVKVCTELDTIWNKEDPPSSDCEWENLITVKLIQACEFLMVKDSRNKARYKVLSERIDRVATNLMMMDILREEFTPEEVDSMKKLAISPSSCNQIQLMTQFQSLQFSSLIKNWGYWARIFERLR